MKVKRFAQHVDHEKSKFWVEYEDIDSSIVKEETIDSHIQDLWFTWAQSNNAIRYEEDGYLVFDYKR